jgi:CRP-like cAMP-binding protein
MEELPASLQYGETVTVDAGRAIFLRGQELEPKPIYYVVAGLVRLAIPASARCPITIYAAPDSLVGIVEVVAGSARLMDAVAMEKTILYRWDDEGYQLAHNVSWELAFQAFTGLSRMLRVLNAEYAGGRR